MTPIEQYIQKFPIEVQQKLSELHLFIKKQVSEAEETISYGIPTFKLNGNLVHFAGYKNHIGFYFGAACIDVFKDDLKAYKTSKGTVQFSLNEPLPFEIIEKIIQFRISENLKK